MDKQNRGHDYAMISPKRFTNMGSQTDGSVTEPADDHNRQESEHIFYTRACLLVFCWCSSSTETVVAGMRVIGLLAVSMPFMSDQSGVTKWSPATQFPYLGS